MKKRDLESFIYLLLLGSFATFSLLVMSYSFTVDDFEKVYVYFNLHQWKISIYDFEWTLKIIIILVSIMAWITLGIFVEKRFKVKIFRRGIYEFDRKQEQLSLLKFIARQQKSSNGTPKTKKKSKL